MTRDQQKKKSRVNERRMKRVRERNDKQKTDRWPLLLQGHKSNNARKEKGGKITGTEMWWGGQSVRERKSESLRQSMMVKDRGEPSR